MNKPKELLKNILGNEGYETLEKSIVKRISESVVDPLEQWLPLLALPRAILAWLVKNIKPMKVNDIKDLVFPGVPDISIHIEKIDVDVYKADFIKDSKVIHSFDKQALPAVGGHILTTLELYDIMLEEGQKEGEDKIALDRKDIIDEHEDLIDKLKNAPRKELVDEAKDQAKELEEYKVMPSASPIKAIMKEAGIDKFSNNSFSDDNVRNLTSIIGKLVDAIVSKKVEGMEKEEVRYKTSNNGTPETSKSIFKAAVKVKDNNDAEVVEIKKEEKNNPKKVPNSVPHDNSKKPEYKYKKTISDFIERHNKKHPDRLIRKPSIFDLSNVHKGENPSGAAVPKVPMQPQMPKPPSNKKQTLNQVNASAKGLPGKVAKPKALKGELKDTEDFIGSKNGYFRKKLDKIEVKKSESTFKINEADVLAPCMHCGKAEFIKSEDGYKFSPCLCFKSEIAEGRKFVELIKTESGYELVFDRKVDPESKYAFLLLFKSRLLLKKRVK